MAETLCQKRALETFRLDPAKWGGKILPNTFIMQFRFLASQTKSGILCDKALSQRNRNRTHYNLDFYLE